ncbi:MAG: FkbM family methyltransferase [Pseudodesulfovibrio sp.]|nr:FkbM family methyltransferase [Pseudodesulfovibrio indicus]
MMKTLESRKKHLDRLMTIKALVEANPFPGLNGLDRRLLNHIKHRNGFFIECGANNGYVQSNTFYLEYCMDWKGVLVEPIPELYNKCKYLRMNSQVFNCALVSSDFKEDHITMRYAGLMSIVKGNKAKDVEDAWIERGAARENIADPYEIEVRTRTLTSILDEVAPEHIDLFSLDVEGYELEVLKGLDLDKYRPDFILVEMHDKDAIINHLQDLYEVHAELTPGWDILFRRKGI